MSYSAVPSRLPSRLVANPWAHRRPLLLLSAVTSLLFLLPPVAFAVSGGTGPGVSGGVCAQGTRGDLACGVASNASGGSSTASGVDSTASGYNSTASGNYSTASGIDSTAGGAGDIALGGLATTSSATEGNIAIGSSTGYVESNPANTPTTATGGNSIAIGTAAQATGFNAIAIGAGVSNSTANSVSFGSNAVTTTGSLSAGNTTVSSLNASNGGITHAGTISGVTPGALTSTSTDAVNGNQLYATNTQQATDMANIGTNTTNISANTTSINTIGTQQGTDMANISANTVRLNALVNGQAGTCTVVNGGLSCGVNATTHGAANTVALGNNASASYAGSVAIGNGAQANADPTTAIGNNAVANGNNSTAVGADSTANGVGSVALGYGSVANRANSVSVGNSATGLNRQITNVAPGTQPTDAVNLGQLTQYAATVGAVTSSLAEAAAQGAMNPHPNSVAVASAAYDGQGAFAVSYQHRFGSDWTAGMSVSTDGTAGNTATSVGGSFGW